MAEHPLFTPFHGLAFHPRSCFFSVIQLQNVSTSFNLALSFLDWWLADTSSPASGCELGAGSPRLDGPAPADQQRT